MGSHRQMTTSSKLRVNSPQFTRTGSARVSRKPCRSSVRVSRRASRIQSWEAVITSKSPPSALSNQPSDLGWLVPLGLQELSRKSMLVSLSDLYPLGQIIGNQQVTFARNARKSGRGNEKITRKSQFPPRHPHHPWSISALSAFSAVKSPRLRASPSPRLSP
jgi:hypothetical protein